MDEQGPGGPGPDHPERPGGRPDREGRPWARAGRRGNGLPADAFSALTEIDPRLAGTVLDALAGAGIAAWVRPFAGTRGGYLEMRVPARPLDCLYVDASRRGDALSVLAEQVPDLLGLRGQDADEASAAGSGAGPAGAAGEAPGGTGAAGTGAPGTDEETGPSAAAEMRPGEIAGPGAAGRDRPDVGQGLDIEAAFAAIVAGYTREALNPHDLPGRSQPHDLPGGAPGESGPGQSGPGQSGPGESGPGDGGTGSGPGDGGPGDEAGARRGSNAAGSPGGPPASTASTWFVPGERRRSPGAPGTEPPRDENDPDLDDHYDPPPAPPSPMPSPPTRWALVSIALGLLLLIAPALVALRGSDFVHVAGVLMICGGVGILVARMRHGDEDDDDPDEGAVV